MGELLVFNCRTLSQKTKPILWSNDSRMMAAQLILSKDTTAQSFYIGFYMDAFTEQRNLEVSSVLKSACQVRLKCLVLL
jgi:hypothetical protein